MLFSSKTAFSGLVLLAALVFLGGCESTQQKLRKEGLGLYNQAQYQGALDKFYQALVYSNQGDALDNYYAGMSAYQLGKYEQAALHFKNAWNADPSMAEVKQAMTETLIRQGKANEAMDFLERDAEYTAKVNDPRVWKTVDKRRYVWETEEQMYLGKGGDRLRIARIYERLGDFDNAKVYYEQAREMSSPRDTKVLMAIALFNEHIGDKKGAGELLKEVYRLEPQTPGLVDALTRNGVLISDLPPAK